MSKQDLLRNLPAVDELLRHPAILSVRRTVPRTLIKIAVREVLEEVRRRILETGEGSEPAVSSEAVAAKVLEHLERKSRPHFRRVINATGVVVHTNLGRSLLCRSALERVTELSGRYSNLEFDLDSGSRGSRYSHVEELLRELTGAESALVVNNNAAAVFLLLDTLARGAEVIVSRGELVEIGGSFRIPDVMARSGACLVEVGATNKTHLRDYETAITDRTALLLKVHTSNFRIIGFTQNVPVPQLAALGGKHGIPVAQDLGSGCLVNLSRFGLLDEPTVQDTLRGGASVVTFSGDKLLGGPQAGLILGKKDLVDRIKRNPMNRAMRIDKMTLAALEATLSLYRDEGTALREIPTLAMITTPMETLNRRARKLKRKLTAVLPSGKATCSLMHGVSRVGGGSLPETDLATRVVALTPEEGGSAGRIEAALRTLPVPVICRIEQNRILLDVRTLLDSELDETARAFETVFKSR